MTMLAAAPRAPSGATSGLRRRRSPSISTAITRLDPCAPPMVVNWAANRSRFLCWNPTPTHRDSRHSLILYLSPTGNPLFEQIVRLRLSAWPQVFEQLFQAYEQKMPVPGMKEFDEMVRASTCPATRPGATALDGTAVQRAAWSVQTTCHRTGTDVRS